MMRDRWQEYLKNVIFSDNPEKSDYLTDLSEWGFLEVSGVDAKKFLQGQLTCDVNELTEKATILGAHCNPQGRIISLFRLFLYHDRYYLILPSSMMLLAQNALKKYAVFSKVALRDASDDFIAIGYQGNHFEELLSLEGIISIKLPEHKERYFLCGPVEKMISLWEKLHKKASLISSSYWKNETLSAMISSIYPETSELFLPQDIHFIEQNGVSFTKGCYTGQEVIARLHYRGKVKTALLKAILNTSTPPTLGGELYNQQGLGVGHILDYAKKGYNDYMLLIVAHAAEALYLDTSQHYLLHIEKGER